MVIWQGDSNCMNIIKRDKTIQPFNVEKIKIAIKKAFASLHSEIDEAVLDQIVIEIQDEFQSRNQTPTVEEVQDLVERELMKHSFYDEAKAYILYRSKRARLREQIAQFEKLVYNPAVPKILMQVEREFGYDLSTLYQKFKTFYKAEDSQKETEKMLVRACVELISMEQPQWEMIAARFQSEFLHQEIKARMLKYGVHSFAEKIAYLEKEGLYGDYIRQAYSDSDIDELEAYIKEERNDLFTYSGLDLLINRYLIRSHSGEILESVQEMFMGIAMHLALPEKDRVFWAKQIYDILSELKVTMATPTMSNARKLFHQMSSCFIDTVPDSLDGIYKSIDNFAQVSKHGGGMGLYFGKVRANGSDIRGFKGAAGGVIRWIKLVNDTAIAVDQLGVRQGAVAVYLDAWHKDLPEFLQLRTNNGDDRMKAHDVFPAICYPDLFWRMVKEDLDGTWYLMCPHEVYTIKGYHLEDSYGKEWEEKYWDCVQDDRIHKRTINIKDLVRLILKSCVETGTPFTFNRDIVNRANPNPHQGMIYCSNLCTEIAQNMKPIQHLPNEVVQVDGQDVVVERYVPGDFVVCNLASLTLGKIDVKNDKELEHIVSVVIRALDNVIDLNYYPIPYAKLTNHKVRPIGLGTSGYHHMLVQNGFRFESEEHLEFVDQLYEKINYYAIRTSMELAKEKGKYEIFEGSDWDTGAYFTKRGYTSDAWKQLQKEVHQNGMRNGYLLAIAPTSSTSIIAGTSACCDPIMNKFFLEEKKGSMIARVAPDLNQQTFWLYKNAHLIDQTWLVKAAGVRQRHIDQAQSVNLYITTEFTMRKLLNLFIQAWEENVKTLYYVRSKSLEVEECESCSA